VRLYPLDLLQIWY